MSPCHKIMREILLLAGYQKPLPDEGAVQDAWDSATSWMEDDAIDDITQEFRHSGIATGIKAPTSRHYESRSMARKLMDGSWVGWTYWYGGGKHGEPGAVRWMEEAYDVDCTEEQKLMTVRTFSRKVVP